LENKITYIQYHGSGENSEQQNCSWSHWQTTWWFSWVQVHS